MKKAAIYISIMIGVSIFVWGCAAQTGSYGQKIIESRITQIGEILKSPKEFKGRVVKVKGKITEECPSGGWFMLKDGSGTIFVNLHPSYFSIPQAVGHDATAEGVVIQEGPQPAITGKGVEVK